LVEDKFWQRLPCVIITGKGFPDLATRAMVHQVSTKFQLPVYGLADCNPFGLSLLMTYKLGSARMGSKFTCDLKWLGLRPSQLAGLNIPEDAMQEMTPRDIARLDSLKALFLSAAPDNLYSSSSSSSSSSASSSRAFQQYIDEIETMRETQQNCELEALISSSFDLSLISALSQFLVKK
jgi:DNA topoisomerase VI subunit A